MMPGLHPGLLMAETKRISFSGIPDYLYISTTGGEGNRSIGMSLTIENGVGPYSYEWGVDAGPFFFDPSYGFVASTSFPYATFSTNTYHDGGLWQFTQVGEAFLTVTDATGASTTINVPIFAGQ